MIPIQSSFPTRFYGSACKRPTNYVEHEPLNQQTYNEWKWSLLAVAQYNTSTLSYLSILTRAKFIKTRSISLN